MVWMNAVERISRLFTTTLHVPKLDVAGSTPVSRSNFSTTWEISSFEKAVKTEVKRGSGI
jgi:hypothetical protein